MNVSPDNNITPAPTSLDSPRRTDGDRAEIRRLAQEFEAMLMTQMLREMRRSMLDDQEDQELGFGAGALTDTTDVELGRSLSRSGGLGLTDALLKAFERQIAGQEGPEGRLRAEGAPAILAEAHDASGAKAGASMRGPTASAKDESIDLRDVTAAAPISSKFGWREDPITGAAQFHRGIDIAVAYGRDVKAAAEGTVSFAGVQNGYGNTVIIDHGDGRETRYAHLSQQFVHAGDAVAEGHVLGKSGNSGRSTGPHLHFEMLVNGRAVDPSLIAE